LATISRETKQSKEIRFSCSIGYSSKDFLSYDAENWEENTKSKIKERYEGQIRDPAEIIEEELLLPFYTFDGDAKISTIATEMIEFKFGDEHECRRRGQKRHFECDGLYHEFLDEFKNRN
jgi:hypothetical protein